MSIIYLLTYRHLDLLINLEEGWRLRLKAYSLYCEGLLMIGNEPMERPSVSFILDALYILSYYCLTVSPFTTVVCISTSVVTPIPLSIFIWLTA